MLVVWGGGGEGVGCVCTCARVWVVDVRVSGCIQVRMWSQTLMVDVSFSIALQLIFLKPFLFVCSIVLLLNLEPINSVVGQ